MTEPRPPLPDAGDAAGRHRAAHDHLFAGINASTAPSGGTP
jgi:hypothetical protein